MTYEFATHHIPETEILSIRDQVEPDTFPAFLGRVFPELFGHVGRHGVIATGHPFVIYHAFGPELIDAEVCVPVAGPVAPEGRIEARTLPEATVVRTVHVGPYEELGAAYTALTEWVDDHRYVGVGPIRERYLTGVSDDVPPSEYRTELDQPIGPVTADAASETVDPRPAVEVG